MKTSPPPFGEGDDACKAAHSFLCGILSVLWLGRILAGQNSRCMVWSAVRNTSRRHLYFTTPGLLRQSVRRGSQRCGRQKNFWKRRKILCILRQDAESDRPESDTETRPRDILPCQTSAQPRWEIKTRRNIPPRSLIASIGRHRGPPPRGFPPPAAPPDSGLPPLAPPGSSRPVLPP